jgi:hypothetical protein
MLGVESELPGDAMNEAGGQKEEPELIEGSKGTEMSIAEKAYFWARPLILAIASLPFAGLILYAAKTDRIEGLIHRPLFMVLALPTLVLWILIALIFKRMIWRRFETGYLLPTGKELKALRARRKFSIRVAIDAYFFVIAILCTKTVLQVAHRGVKAWAVLALVWLIMAYIYVLAARPSLKKLAIAGVAGQFCLFSISASLSAAHIQHDKGAAWALAVVMWTFSAGFIAWSLRPPAPKAAPPIAPEELETVQGDVSR